ncbi:MAG: DUF86 domain-containing protein [Selenomonadaceae bacterium]|nr:DUF86 domain-containing protein [Selenomonadaceae bacterium]
MRGKQADLQRLFHIVNYCKKLQVVKDYVQTYERFIDDKNYEKVDVSAFYIGQIGELAHGLSDEMKNTLSDIPWRQINDMRNKLIHHYGKRDPEMIWQVVTEDSKILAERCLEVLNAEETDIVFDD